ncbi:hypothetical protein LTR09_010701 [Extremus antarcticus]|uniref:F-box domain-containing protein n=1 Tax=Extremus antarcticus TaxID=702011 RepID=A0AAJ0G4W2_9PEZI|nr:hypothetical protein LTR09_010701 [Extremus antarcticus]
MDYLTPDMDYLTGSPPPVLSIPELLENIIVHLPPPTIVNARRASKLWNALITSSKAVRRAVVLRPVVTTNK